MSAPRCGDRAAGRSLLDSAPDDGSARPAGRKQSQRDELQASKLRVVLGSISHPRFELDERHQCYRRRSYRASKGFATKGHIFYIACSFAISSLRWLECRTIDSIRALECLQSIKSRSLAMPSTRRNHDPRQALGASSSWLD